jgi:peptidoglycan/xylan/chitin deacetylase (PgdA/CDA1 family)
VLYIIQEVCNTLKTLLHCVTNPFILAARAKGCLGLLRRLWTIGRHYGLTSAKTDWALTLFSRVLRDFDCSATLAIPAKVLERHGVLIREYQEQGIEFALHGYLHIDHSRLSQDDQLAHLAQARQVFDNAGIRYSGFRAPYLRWNADTMTAISQLCFDYDSSHTLAWDVLDEHNVAAYHLALKFYGTRSAENYPALPHIEGRIMRFFYCIPDDEVIVDRLHLTTSEQISDVWLAMLRRTYELGEVFVLGLHPERIALCEIPLATVLTEARSLMPGVWIARLDEIAAWWRARTEAKITVSNLGHNMLKLNIDGPPWTTVMARSVEVEAPSEPWSDGYRWVEGTDFTFCAPVRPFIGIAPGSSPELISFLKQQGYIIEVNAENWLYPFYLDRPIFTPEDERPLLAQIETGNWPLIRLGRWPAGIRSVLSVTGDIDALNIWDYVLRLFGH